MSEEFDAKTTKFLNFCEENGIGFKLTSQGVRFRECPTCGTSDYKAYMYLDNGPLTGSCAKCSWKFSAKTFLQESGFDESDIYEACGSDMALEIEEDIPQYNQQKNEKNNEFPTIERPNHWVSINNDITHPSAVYAKKRHVCESIYDRVLIDTSVGGVVFIVTDLKNREVGYQIRFTNPRNPKIKTKTMTGFEAKKNLFYLIRPKRPILLCEGPFDTVAAYKLGYSSACFFGSSPSPEQMGMVEFLMLDRNISSVIVCFDRDSPGYKASSIAARYCQENGLKYIYGIPDFGKDVSESLDKGGGISFSRELKTESSFFDIG